MAFKKNVIKVDLCSYPPYVIMGEPKSGKSTLFRDLVLHNYGKEESGLLISFKDEDGYLALDRLQFEKTIEWNSDEDEETGLRGFVQIVDDLVENKKDYEIKMVAFDTYDKLVEMAITEVLKQHKKEKGTPCKSINDALGGYGKGRDYLLEIILKQIGRLRGAGYAIFILAHTKFKEKTDPLTGDTYEQLTNNLRADYYNAIANIAQMITNITVEREVKEGKQVGEKRVIYFRSNGIVDAGGRFANLPEKLPLSAEHFMDAFNIGVKSSFLGGVSDKVIETQKKVEVKEIASAADVAWKKEQAEIQQELAHDDVAEYVTIIQAKFPKAKDDVKETIRGIMSEYNIANFKTPEELSPEGLKKIVEALA